MRWYTIFWLTWVVAAVLVEFYVLIFNVRGGTLSEHVWALRDRGSGFFSLLMFFLAWMIYHFIRERVGGINPPDIPTLPEGGS